MTDQLARSLGIWRLRMERLPYESVLVLALKGRISAATAGALREAFDDIIGQGHTRLVVDLTEVDYISSQGLQALDDAGGRLAASQGCLVLCGMGDAVRIAFGLAAMASPLLVEADRAAAVRDAGGLWTERPMTTDAG